MKSLIISIVVTAILIGSAVMLARGTGSRSQSSTNNVSDENGIQIIAIDVKGDYQPRLTEAKAGKPSLLRLRTNGTYSCARALKIPALGFEKYLQPSGATEVQVPPQTAGTSLQGTCAMGMYSFEIRFI